VRIIDGEMDLSCFNLCKKYPDSLPVDYVSSNVRKIILSSNIFKSILYYFDRDVVLILRFACMRY
jgi:hypothetical protein